MVTCLKVKMEAWRSTFLVYIYTMNKAKNGRISKGKQASMNIEWLLKLYLKKSIVKCTVWSVAETWIMIQTDIERLEVFEMWLWMRMLQISWVYKVSNAVLRKVQENLTLKGRGMKKNVVGYILYCYIL